MPATPVVNDAVEVWQVPQSPVVGCAASCAAVGRVTIVTPNQLLPVSWQVAHVVAATGVWFIGVPAKLVKLAGAWQLSHAAVVGMWFAGLVLRLVTPVNALPVSWQFAHPVAIPVCTIAVPGPKAVVEVWQVMQSAVVGMWPAPCGFGVTPVNTVPAVLAA